MVIARSAKAGPNVSLDIDTSPVIESRVKLKPPDDEPSGKDSSSVPSSTFICRAERDRLSPTRKWPSWTTGWLGCERLMVDSCDDATHEARERRLRRRGGGHGRRRTARRTTA